MPAWVKPICDIVLARLYHWKVNYTRGEVDATCQFHDPQMGVVDKPTRYAHMMVWRPAEFDALIRIMDELCPNKALVEELRKIRTQVLPKGILTIGGGRKFKVSMYPEYVNLLFDTMLEARDGKKTTLADKIKEEGLF